MTNGILDEFSWPEGWQATPLGRLADRRKDAGRATLTPLSVFLDQGVVPRSSREDNYNRLGADLSQYLVVEPGDLVFNKLRTWQGGLGVSEYRGIVSPAYFVCRPRPGLSPRFAHYALRSALYLQELTRVSKSMPPAQFDIAWEDLRDVVVRVPPLEVQRAIADYLDVETARIDTLVASRQRLIELLNERRSAVIADLTGGHMGHREAAARTRLKFAVGRPTSGNRDHSFTSDDSGIPCLRGLNIKPGWVDQANLMRISEADHLEHAATTLHAGDVVIVRSGNAGTAAVVPPELDGANCVDLVIIRQSANVEPRYLEYILNSPQARTQADMGVFGATLTHFNAVDIAELSLFIPTVCEQRARVSMLNERTSRIDSASEAMQRQVSILLERRQALITAAVTGQLEIPGVAA